MRTRLGSRRLLSGRHYRNRVSGDYRVVGYESETFGPALGDEHAVERVTVQEGETGGQFGVTEGYGQFYICCAFDQFGKILSCL